MAVVTSLSQLQGEYQRYMQNGGLKPGFGYTFGHDSLERMVHYRTTYLRTSFVPCTGSGDPAIAPGSSPTLNYVSRKATRILQEGLFKAITNPVDTAVNILQNIAFAGDIGGRKIVHLYTNPYKAEFKWSRTDPSDSRSGTDKGEVDKTRGNFRRPTTVTGLRGRTSIDWSKPDGFITLYGYSGNAPELQVPRLKYLFGLNDPSIASSRALNVIAGNARLRDQLGGGAYVTDASMYLWELWYPLVYLKSSEGKYTSAPDYVEGVNENPYPEFRQPARYLGLVKSLDFVESSQDPNSLGDINWTITFEVLQRRDYDKGISGP